ncbi:unnamed protein product [Discosporangium mesarthrocarpum]
MNTRGSGLEPMPMRFLLAENGDLEKAWARWAVTSAWRQEMTADHILSIPHHSFDQIKKHYKHCFHLSDHDGRLTYYERPGKSDLASLRREGIDKKQLLWHYIYCMEYLWQVLQPRQEQKLTIIIDLEGVGMRDLVGDSVSFLKTTVGMMAKHYPQRSFKILILNAPSFFNSIFSLVKPMLNENTKKKIDVVPPHNMALEMLKTIPAASLPPEYGGSCEVPLMESQAEINLAKHAKKIIEESNTVASRGSGVPTQEVEGAPH